MRGREETAGSYTEGGKIPLLRCPPKEKFEILSLLNIIFLKMPPVGPCESVFFLIRSRETENLEYLKNVIFHFMCSDSGREQLIVPIATILHFTPNEVSSA